MAFTFNGLTASVTISGSVTTTNQIIIPSSTQTLIHKYNVVGAAVTDLYTIPANKIFYLYGVMGSTAANGWNRVYENDGATIITMLSSLAGASQSFSSAIPIASFTAAQVVKGESSGANGVIVIEGVLVDA